MSFIIRRTEELSLSAPIVCTASRIGRPARRNAAIWRDRCMTSSRLTRGPVISNCRRLFFSVTLEVAQLPLVERQLGVAAARGLLGPLDLVAVERDADVGELGHGQTPAT